MRSIKYLLAVMVFLSSISCGWFIWFASAPLALQGRPRVDFSISAGASLRSASQQMADAGLGFSPWQFTLLVRLLGKATELKAGSYEVEQGATPLTLLNKLTQGDFSQDQIVFVEGKTFRQMRAQLDAHPSLRHDTQGWTDQDILARLDVPEKHPEGLFFPDTYLFAKHSSDLDVLRRAYRAMQQHLDLAWRQRDPLIQLSTPYQVLIMASIIEKETGQTADRPQIAAVFSNRLRRGMLLQTDPSVIYGIGEKFDGNLRKRDLQGDSPYNTYLRSGLPPTPIAMPGLASLQAALHPPQSDKLYFVARGDGTSEFSRSLDEHNRAVNKYQRGR